MVVRWLVSLKEPGGKAKVGEERHCVHFYAHWILEHVDIHYLVNLFKSRTRNVAHMGEAC